MAPYVHKLECVAHHMTSLDSTLSSLRIKLALATEQGEIAFTLSVNTSLCNNVGSWFISMLSGSLGFKLPGES